MTFLFYFIQPKITMLQSLMLAFLSQMLISQSRCILISSVKMKIKFLPNTNLPTKYVILQELRN